MKTNYRHLKKLKEQARLTRQSEKQQRRAASKGTPPDVTGNAEGAVTDGSVASKADA